MKKLKDYSNRTPEGKYIPKTVLNNNNNIHGFNNNSSLKISPINKTQQSTKIENDKHDDFILEIRSKDWVDNKRNFSHAYEARCLEKSLMVNNIKLEHVRMPSPERSFNVHPASLQEEGTNELRYNEGLIIENDNDRKAIIDENLTIIIPKTIESISSLTFIDNGIYIDVTTDNIHGLISDDIIYLYNINATGYNANIQKHPFRVINVSSDTIFRCQYHTTTIYLIPNTFNPTNVLFLPLLNQNELSKICNNRIPKNINYNIQYKNMKYEITKSDGTIFNKFTLFPFENWRSYCRVRIPSIYYSSISTFASFLEQGWNPPHTTSSMTLRIIDENDSATNISLTDTEYKSCNDLCLELENSINSTLSWNIYSNKLSITYNIDTARFSFSRFLPFSIDFSSYSSTATFFGFYPKNYFSSESLISEFPVYFREPIQKCISNNRYSVSVDTILDSLYIECLTVSQWCSLKNISNTYTNTLPITVQPIVFFPNYLSSIIGLSLQMKGINNFTLITKSQLSNFLYPPLYLLIQIKETDSAIRSQIDFIGNLKENIQSEGYFGVLQRKDASYYLFYAPNIKLLSNLKLDKLTIRIVYPDGIPFNTDNLSHEIIVKLSIEY